MVILKILRTILHIVSNICYFLIGLYGIICIPMIFGYKPLVVLSGSMEPTYHIGSILYYHHVEQQDLKENDVITFSYEEETFITHRIDEIVGDKYRTKGDANNTSDAREIEFSNIIGKVSKINIPFIGYYINFINNHVYILGIVLIILISEFLLGDVETFDINRKKERK